MMVQILESVSSQELLTAMDANMRAFWSAYGRAEGSALEQGPGAVLFYTGVPHPLFNGVLAGALESDDVQALFNVLQARIDKQGAPAFWWIGPRSDTNELGPMLEHYGLEPAGPVPGMALELQALDGEPPPIAEFTIRRVDGAPEQAVWARIAALGTGFSNAATQALETLEARLFDPAYRAQRRYIGFLNGEPVATSALVLDSGVAGIYAVATIPAARGQGIGTLMTLVPLHEARGLGYRVAILQASSMGYSIYTKIGFSDVGVYQLFLQSK